MTGFLHPSDEVVKEAEAAAVEGEAVDFLQVDADRKDEVRDVVAEEVLVPAVGAPQRGGVVACGVQGPLVDGGGELPGAGSAGDGHACLPRALAVRVIHHDPALTSEGARTPILSSIHGHVFLELRPSADEYYAARNKFERFRWFLDLINRFEFEFCRYHTQCGRTCACAVAYLCPHNSISNVVVSLTIHDNVHIHRTCRKKT